MTQDEKYQLDIINTQTEQCCSAIKIAHDGLKEMGEELKKAQDYLKELGLAKENLKTNGVVVTLFEYSNVKKEIELCNSVIRQHQAKILNIQNFLKEREKELANWINKKEEFISVTKRGVIIQFRGKHG